MNDIRPPKRPLVGDRQQPIMSRRSPDERPTQPGIVPQRSIQSEATRQHSSAPTESVRTEPPVQDKAPVALSVAPSKNRSGWRKKLTLTIIGLLICIVAVGVGGFFWYQQNLKAVQSGSSEMVKLTIAPGTGPEAIGKQLKDSELIRNETAFNWYVRTNGKAGLLQAGSYRLSKGEDVPAIVKHLTSGNTDTFSITFLPGETLAKHRKALINAGYSDDDVDAALNKTYDSPLFADKPADSDLEGYIYGETYNFSADSSPEDILSYVFDYYWGVIEKENLVSLYKAKGFTLYEGITLASIIQREVATVEDAAQVSQVFHLRLKTDMPLGSDPTYQYIADKTGQQRDINLDSPYNTRRYKGLTPGPIATPGIDSLKAVANPAKGDYLYFLSGDDDKTYFAHTFEEHERNIRTHCQKKCQII